MKLPSHFLIALAQCFAAMGLYREGHPARERAFSNLLALAHELQGAEPEVEYTFLSGEVVWGDEPLWEMKGWEWAGRFSEAGIQRLAFSGPVTAEDLRSFLSEVTALLAGEADSPSQDGWERGSSIRYGEVELRAEEEDSEKEKEGEEAEGEEGEAARREAEARRKEEARRRRELARTLGFTLRDEAEAIDWVHTELQERGELHLLEVEAVVRSLSVAMHGDQRVLIPLLQLAGADRYATTHAMNVSVLSMALAEALGMAEKEVGEIGIAALLHDIGMVSVPAEIRNKAGELTDEEREIVHRHPIDGARQILETDHHLDLAAIVAYEHHIRVDGGGYPTLTYPRSCHQCSKLVHICSVYDALRSARPWRAGWEHGRILESIRDGAGREFDTELAEAFLRMMAREESRISILRSDEEAVRKG